MVAAANSTVGAEMVMAMSADERSRFAPSSRSSNHSAPTAAINHTAPATRPLVRGSSFTGSTDAITRATTPSTT